MKKIITLAMLLVSSLSGRSQLIAHYDFNNINISSGVLPDVAHGYHARLVGGTNITAVGTTALHFNNNWAGISAYAIVDTSSAFKLPTWTIATRVRFTQFNQVANKCQVSTLVAKGTGQYASDYMCVEVNDNYNQVSSCSTVNAANNSCYGCASGPMPAYPVQPPTLLTGQWYCIVTTYDGDTLRGYLDGVRMYAVPSSNPYTFITPNPSLYIAARDLSGNFNLDGDIDDIQIYAQALSPMQITQMNCQNVAMQDPWLTTGNYILAGNNTFGTLTNDDVKIVTNKTPVGIITKTGRYGFGNQSPATRVEITNVGGVAGSGLKFTNLNSSSAPLANPTGKVLALDGTGNVILANGGSGSTYTSNQGIALTGTVFSLGDSCNGTTSNPFLSDRMLNMNNRNLYFSSGDNGRVYMGLSSCQPIGSRLEINSNGLSYAANSYTIGAPSLSGLRLSNLTHQMPAITPLPLGTGRYGVLSLDNEGDVIWVEDQTGSSAANNGVSVSGGNIQLGEDCNNPTNAANLTSDRAVPLNDNNVLFRDGGLGRQGANRVGIGTSCMPGAKLEVIRNTEPAPYDWTNRAIAGINNDMALPVNPMTGGLGEAAGMYGEANNMQNMVNLGGDFVGTAAQNTTYGVRGSAQSFGGNNAYGGWFTACGANNTNVGVYGDVCQGSGRRGMDWAGYFNGDTYCPAGIWTSSDRRIKQNIEPIANALMLIDKIQPRKYQYNTSVFPGLHLPGKTDNYGVIAQELEEVLPALVKEAPVPDAEKKAFSGATIKTVNYTELIPILIQAVKEQQVEIEALKTEKDTYKAALEEKMSMLEKSISQICESGCPGLSKNTPATDGASTKDQLFQSVPNPTDNRAIINYYLSRMYESAQIVITDMEGHAIQTIPLQSKAGSGSINVELGSFAAQVYVYTLYANGHTVDSKKMTVLK